MAFDKDGNEVFLMRFADGPLSGKVGIQSLTGAGGNFSISEKALPWPLPDRLGVLTVPGSDNVAFWDADDVENAELPEAITASPNAVTYRKISESQITNEEAIGMTHVARGAEYELEAP